MILCLGTTPAVQRIMTFARLQPDAVNRAIDVKEMASGKVINVARVAHTLGEESIATGFLGGVGEKIIRQDLDRSGIAHDFVSVEAPTRTCVTVLDQNAGTATELIEESREVEASAWDRLRQRIQELLKRAKIMVMSGSLPPGAPQDFYGWCVQAANAAGAAAIVDGSGEPLLRALEARPLLVKPNRIELALTLGAGIENDRQLADAMRRLIHMGAPWAMVTMGAEGVILTDGKDVRRVRPPKVKAINAIGSGDALAAGVAVGLVPGLDMLNASRLGVACGAANAQTPWPGVVEKQRVEELLKSVEVTES
jgi:tagatose 6-phosphate kinase